MTIHTGKLIRPRTYLTHKHPYGPGSSDIHYTAPTGTVVEWDDAKGPATNAGYEGSYGGRLLHWVHLPEYEYGIGAELGVDFVWDESEALA